MKIGVTHRKRGVALVVVLSCLLLVCGLVLSFFLSVSTETKASKIADGSSRSRDLTDAVVSIAMAQVRAATTQGSNIAWASQPGMIRTYGSPSGAASSSPLTYYKLYSSDQMTVNASATAFVASADVDSAWYSKPALFADLNTPVKNFEGIDLYPILDPSSLTLDPSLRPQGFNITGAPVDATTPTGASSNQAPMPVKWLYVLKDGSLTSPTGGAEAAPNGRGATATWAGSSKSPTKDNPIVGRVAFWTDDESAKVNINTAAGDVWASSNDPTNPVPGTYWDVPHFDSTFDKQRLSLSQPAQLEYQRYPGHPATTYLSAVLPDLTREQIGKIAARVQAGGSLGGTTKASNKVGLDNDRLYASIDELVFEQALGGQNRVAQEGFTTTQLERGRFFLTAHSRAPEITLFNTPRVSIWPVHNLENTGAIKYRTPYDSLIAFCSQLKIGASPREYYFKRANAFLPSADYITIARNQILYSYLQNLTDRDIPGFGGKFTDADKYSLDRDQILTQIFDYIRSTNLFDDSLEPLPYTYPTKGKQFTPGRTSATGAALAHGQVAPTLRPGSSEPTKGFGRFDTISEVGLHFVCTADPLYEDSNQIEDKDAAGGKPAYFKNKTLEKQLVTGERRIEAAFLMELFSPMHGWTALGRDMKIRIQGLEQLFIQGDGDSSAQPLGFPADATIYTRATSQGTIHGRGWGGMGGFRTFMRARGLPARGVMPKDANSSTIENTYPFVSAPVTIKPGANDNMTLIATGPIKIMLYAGTGSPPSPMPLYPSNPQHIPSESQLVQTIEVNFSEPGTGPSIFPTPKLVRTGVDDFSASANSWMHGKSYSSTMENWWTYSRDGAINDGSSNAKPFKNYGDSFSVTGKLGRIAWIGDEPGRNNRSKVPASGGRGEASGSPFRDEDVMRSLVPEHGDYRLIAAKSEVPSDVFVPHQYYYNLAKPLAHSMTEVLGSDMIYGATMEGKYAKDANYTASRRPDVPFKNSIPWGSDSGDWDTGIGNVIDGPYINKPDEGSAYDAEEASVPYYNYTERHQTAGPTFFSPNRQVMSPVMFGSLPTQVIADVPWRTLLFRPDPGPQTGVNHVGARSPKDHLLLDLFWMPVVEPYAISEPFSTAGKINMNYQIVPFTYITRSTGLRALLRSERVPAVPFNHGNKYKSGAAEPYRYEIDADATLAQFEERFSANTIFKSATELCELYLIPKNVPGNVDLTATVMPDFWGKTFTLTGDNLKERPYASLYPRLTTKSNTYTVHYRVQVLQQAVRSRGADTTAWATWNEDTDNVSAEYRGSSTFERYIDPSDPNLVDYASIINTSSNYTPLDQFYRYRVINSKRFSP